MFNDMSLDKYWLITIDRYHATRWRKVRRRTALRDLAQLRTMKQASPGISASTVMSQPDVNKTVRLPAFGGGLWLEAMKTDCLN